MSAARKALVLAVALCFFVGCGARSAGTPLASATPEPVGTALTVQDTAALPGESYDVTVTLRLQTQAALLLGGTFVVRLPQGILLEAGDVSLAGEAAQAVHQLTAEQLPGPEGYNSFLVCVAGVGTSPQDGAVDILMHLHGFAKADLPGACLQQDEKGEYFAVSCAAHPRGEDWQLSDNTQQPLADAQAAQSVTYTPGRVYLG